jgi:HSP20 family protein
MPDLTVWKEQQIRRMRRDIDRLFAEFFREFRPPLLAEVLGEAPIIELSEKGDKVIVTVELPGFRPEDLDVSASADFLMLRGEKRDVERGPGTIRQSGSFTNRLRLPCKIRPDQVEASFHHDTLQIVMSKCRPGGFQKVTIRPEQE